MEALLPSEISRLVLGFIEEQNCTEAAKLFLETCPHLKECAAAAQSGRKFGTQVYGKNLVNILDEYTLLHSIVHEHIQELPENAASQLKSSCGNFLPDQVKHLLNGKSAGQRFHVNITVPTQVGVPQSSITSLGGLISNSSQCHQRSKSRSSPASARHRRTAHLMQEKRLTLKSQDPLEDVTASVTVHRIEAFESESSERGTRDEEENGSLLDPKTGEFISPCDKSLLVKNNSEGPKTGPVETVGTLSVYNQDKEVARSDEVVKFSGEEQVFGRASTGRTSLDKFVSDILACHETEESRQKKHPSITRAEAAAETVGSLEQTLTPSNAGSQLLHHSPTDKDAQKSVPDYLYTPKRSGAKRKAKPTPLKMITPLKTKAYPEESSEVMLDPKLHEKIAENINQLIWSCGGEAETAEVHAPEALPLSTSGETVMHQELEKAIKTVVDKTEADPLFERLLNEILDPEYEEENLMDKSEMEKGMTTMSLDDQNEEAINSILKATPVEENPKPSGGLCKDQVHSVKIVRGRPSGACKSIFSEVTGRGKNLSANNLPTVHKNRVQVNKLVLVPIVDILGPPLSFPRININGVDQYIVPVESLGSIPIVRSSDPLGSNMTPAPVNPYIFRKVTSEDLKNINSQPMLPIASTELTPIAPLSTKPLFFHLQLQNPQPFATSTPSTSASFIQISNSVAQDSQSCTVLSKTVEGHSVANVDENESESNKTLKEPNSEKESTPTVLNPRLERAVTEGRLPILEPPRATPLMTIGGRRVSLSTPRRSRSSGHVRALDFGSTPPSKQILQDSQFSVSSLSRKDLKHMRQNAASKTMRNDLQKVLDTSDKLPDPSTCIATRSPPPRLSKAWNKVGVDLIFGGSPNEITFSGQESEANDTEVNLDKKNISVEEACQSPKLRLKKGTWDADLRAIVSSAELKPKLTKKQQKAKERKERALKRAAEKKEKKEEKKGLEKSEAEQGNGKEKNSVEEKSTEEITSEDAKEEDKSTKKGQQRKSKGQGIRKKKAETKKSLEKAETTGDANNSPEKVWVVQQSPGSLATKRSIHEVTSLDAEKASARKHLDLQETPRKSDLSIASLRRYCVGEDALSACDRTTLTVVETPLFPMTPNINLLSTPNGQDSREFAETFPSYYKPSVSEIIEKEYLLEESVISKCRQEEEDILKATNSSKVNGSNIEGEDEGSDNCKKKNVKVSGNKKGQRKPAVRKKQTPVEEQVVAERRVLRPRRSKTSYKEEPLEDEEKQSNGSKKEESDEDCPLSVLLRKNAKRGDDSIEVESIPEPLSKELQKNLDSIALEEAQTQEAEMLARSISLKLSPLCSKATLLEEEETDEDSASSDGPLIRKTSSKAVAKPICSSSSSSDSDSSNSSSYSSDISSDEDGRSPETSPNSKSLNASQNDNEIFVEVNSVVMKAHSESVKSSAVDCHPASKSFDKVQNLFTEVVLDDGKTFRNETVPKANLIERQNDKTSESRVVAEKINCHINAVGSNEKEKDKLRIEEEKGIVESRNKKESFAADRQDKKTNANMSKSNESIAVESRSDDVKMRKDNLDKLLCLNKKESPENHEDVILGVGGDSTSIMNPSYAELSLSHELEQKKLRALCKIKGAASITKKPNVVQKIPMRQSQKLVSPSKAENDISKENKASSETMNKSAVISSHQSVPEQSKLIVEEDEEDCPTLRLSEGEDATSPNKRISPRNFELLDSVEETLALMHSEIRSPTIKKTARMSCSPHSSKKEALQTPVKNALEKSKSDVSCVSTCSNQKEATEKAQGIVMEPSTRTERRAAGRTLKAAERILSKKNASLSAGSRSSRQLTVEDRNNLNGSEYKNTILLPSNCVSSNSTENKEIRNNSRPSESSENCQEKDAPAIDAESVQEYSQGEVTEAEEWSKRDSRRKRISNLFDSTVDPIVPKKNQKQKANIISKIDGSFELAKVSMEGNEGRSSCFNKAISDVSAEKDMLFLSNAKEGETMNMKKDKLIKSVKCKAKKSLFEGERSSNKSKETDSTTPSHFQLNILDSGAHDENGAISAETSEITKDSSNIKTNQNRSSPTVPCSHRRITNDCLRETVRLALEPVDGKHRETLNLERKISKVGFEHGKVEKYNRSPQSIGCLENTAKSEKGAHPSKQKVNNEEKESEMGSSILIDNSSHRSKTSQIGKDKSDTLRERKKNHLGKDGFSSNLQIGLIIEDSALPNPECDSGRKANEDNILNLPFLDERVECGSVTEISFELDEGIVRLTMSPYIELLSYVNDDEGVRMATPQVALRHKGGGECSSSRKRKHSNLFDTETERSKKEIPSKVAVKKKQLNIRRNDSDELKIKKVLETLSNPSTGSGSVDDDSLFTYTVLGCVDSEEIHAKEDEERILPLKKRRTTTEETPVKFQADGSHGNTGIISQLKTMEIEDFLSKVHGDG